MEKNAGKIMITIDKPLDKTVTALGVSLQTVDRVYLESQATGVHIYHTVNTYDIPRNNSIPTYTQINTHK